MKKSLSMLPRSDVATNSYSGKCTEWYNVARESERLMDQETAIIIPVYNEATVLKKVIRDVKKEFKYIVCVDDGSSDNSVDIINAQDVFLVEHPINLGQGAAIQTGIEFALTLPVKYYCTFDADGQHRLEDVKKMLDELKQKQCDIVLGSRFLGSTVGMSTAKRLLLKAATYFTNKTTGLTLTDTHNGLRVFNRKVASNMRIKCSDMSHASEILEIIAKKGYVYREVPVTIRYTEYSVGKGQSFINAVNIGFDTILRRIAK